MNYYIDVFTPETYEVFAESDQTVVGFKKAHRAFVKQVNIGDKFICYLSHYSRWMGVLEVVSEYFEDHMPLLYPENDPLVLRFKVKTLAWLSKEKAIPMHEDKIFKQLSFTKNAQKPNSWISKIRRSLTPLKDQDAKHLEKLILSQTNSDIVYDIDPKLRPKTAEKNITPIEKKQKNIDIEPPKATTIEEPSPISISPETNKKPKKKKALSETAPLPEIKIETNAFQKPKSVENPPSSYNKSKLVETKSTLAIQKLIALAGLEMGLRIWLPKHTREALKTDLKDYQDNILDELKLHYDDQTNHLIKSMDILWFKDKGRKITRAFVIASHQSIQKNLLDLGDLFTLQPNLLLKAHIIASADDKELVLEEMHRPFFALQDHLNLSENCTYISFESIQEISNQKHLAHLSETILDEYTVNLK